MNSGTADWISRSNTFFSKSGRWANVATANPAAPVIAMALPPQTKSGSGSDLTAMPIHRAGPALRTAADLEHKRYPPWFRSWLLLSRFQEKEMGERPMAAHADELHAMIAALAGSQALTLDALCRRGSIGQEELTISWR